MSKSKLGQLPDSAFETDIIINPKVDKHYSPAYLENRRKLEDRIKDQMEQKRGKK